MTPCIVETTGAVTIPPVFHIIGYLLLAYFLARMIARRINNSLNYKDAYTQAERDDNEH